MSPVDQRINTAEELQWPRYQACVTLHQLHIPYVVWFEDALRYFQVPTRTFDLYLLVNDLDRAIKPLISSGWTLDTSSPANIGGMAVSTAQYRLSCPNPQPQTPTSIDTTQLTLLPEALARDQIVLLLANDWHFDLSADGATIIKSSVHVPHLPILLDCLIETLLEESSDKSLLSTRVASYI
ncbi:MAG: hypothetical protein M1829_002304 [Trizodia sp. TS-e1964]|nr:MAG: hypothetical protein M1829_002304 [Trizodia sp. TS-e1964]